MTSNTTFDTERVHKLINRVARAYARRCWWADEKELRNVGWEAVLTAEEKKTYDPAVGVPYDKYMKRVAVLSMREALWRASAPVSAPKGHADRLRGVHHGSLDLAAREADATPWSDQLVADRRWRIKARNYLLRAVLGDDLASLGLRCLLSEEKPQDFADRFGIDVAKVYRARARAKEAIFNSLELYRLTMGEGDEDT